MEDYFWDLVNGNIGKVVPDNDDCLFIVDGKEYEIDSYVTSVDEFLDGKDLSKLTLFRGDGYRGVCCYYGAYVDETGVYMLDIVSEDQVCKMKEVK